MRVNRGRCGSGLLESVKYLHCLWSVWLHQHQGHERRREGEMGGIGGSGGGGGLMLVASDRFECIVDILCVISVSADLIPSIQSIN